MYKKCLFCHSRLGRNETVETFQTGRCLAFDQAKGRLWVVCPKCFRWNLSPLEERWEAIEQCEEAFRRTVLRKSTENIGLARMKDGTDLIRIGKPLLPEFAGWRYQARLVRRYQMHQRFFGAGLAGNIGYHTLSLAKMLTASTTVYAASLLLGVAFVGLIGAQFVFRRRVQGGRYTAVVLPGSDQQLRVRSADVGVLRVLPDEQAGWKIRLPHTRGVAELTGPNAVFAVGLVLPRVTWRIASPEVVQRGVKRIIAEGGPEALFASIARENRGRYGTIVNADSQVAAEISANQTAESEHLADHLRLLEAQWRDAEQIAEIADNLLVPEQVNNRWHEVRQGVHIDGTGEHPTTSTAHNDRLQQSRRPD